MVEWEVNIQPKNHSKNHIMDYALSATVTSVIYDEVVDINISTAFNTEFSLNDIPKNVSMPDKDSYGFAESINARDEMTKFSANPYESLSGMDTFLGIAFSENSALKAVEILISTTSS